MRLAKCSFSPQEVTLTFIFSFWLFLILVFLETWVSKCLSPPAKGAVTVLVYTEDTCSLDKLNWQVEVISQKDFIMWLRQLAVLRNAEKGWPEGHAAKQGMKQTEESSKLPGKVEGMVTHMATLHQIAI